MSQVNSFVIASKCGLENRAKRHIKAANLQGEDASNTSQILYALETHCRPRSNEIVAATVYKQLVQGVVVHLK